MYATIDAILEKVSSSFAKATYLNNKNNVVMNIFGIFGHTINLNANSFVYDWRKWL